MTSTAPLNIHGNPACQQLSTTMFEPNANWHFVWYLEIPLWVIGNQGKSISLSKRKKPGRAWTLWLIIAVSDWTRPRRTDGKQNHKKGPRSRVKQHKKPRVDLEPKLFTTKCLRPFSCWVVAPHFFCIMTWIIRPGTILCFFEQYICVESLEQYQGMNPPIEHGFNQESMAGAPLHGGFWASAGHPP